MNEYIDVRGVHPMYVCGVIAIQLVNWPRDIELELARVVVADILLRE